jgi:hypothetical protein
MANNYLQMSESYALNEAQAAWVQKFMEDCWLYEGGQDLDPDSPEGKRFLAMVDPNEESDDLSDLAVRAANHFTLERDRDGKASLWIHGDEYVNVDVVTMVLSTMLEETASDDVMTGTWAETCSKPRIGEFGGGWFAVAAKRILFGSTWDEARKAAKTMKQEA